MNLKSSLTPGSGLRVVKVKCTVCSVLQITDYKGKEFVLAFHKFSVYRQMPCQFWKWNCSVLQQIIADQGERYWVALQLISGPKEWNLKWSWSGLAHHARTIRGEMMFIDLMPECYCVTVNWYNFVPEIYVIGSQFLFFTTLLIFCKVSTNNKN